MECLSSRQNDKTLLLCLGQQMSIALACEQVVVCAKLLKYHVIHVICDKNRWNNDNCHLPLPFTVIFMISGRLDFTYGVQSL